MTPLPKNQNKPVNWKLTRVPAQFWSHCWTADVLRTLWDCSAWTSEDVLAQKDGSQFPEWVMTTGPSREETVSGDPPVPSLEDHRVWRRPMQVCGRLSSPPSSCVEIKLGQVSCLCPCCYGQTGGPTVLAAGSNQNRDFEGFLFSLI